MFDIYVYIHTKIFKFVFMFCIKLCKLNMAIMIVKKIFAHATKDILK